MSHPSHRPTTSLPVGSVHDYLAAAEDLATGRFGSAAVTGDGESAARLSAERVAEFRSRLAELVAEYFGPEAAQWSAPVKYGFRWYLAPVDLAPADDHRVRTRLT